MSNQHALDSPSPAPLVRPWHGAAVLFVAIVIRLAFIAQLHGSILFQEPQGDARLHFDLAREIAAGDWLGQKIFYYAPLYPYVVALVFSVCGATVLAVALFQVALSVVEVGVIMSLARRVFGHGVGLIAGMLAASYGPFVFYTGFLLKETLGLVLLDTFLLTGICAVQRSSWSLSFVAGLLLGLTTLVRPNLLPLTLIVAAWLCFEMRGAVWYRTAAAVTCFAAGVGAAVLPVSARNYVVGKEWVWISAHGGHNFFIGNRVGASGLYLPLVPGGGQTPYEEERDAKLIAEQVTGRSLRLSEVSAYWYARGWREIREHPGNFIRVTLRKFALFWNDYEVPDFQDFYFIRLQVPVLWLAPITLGMLVPLAGVGIVASWPQWRGCLLLYLVIVGVFATVLPFFIFARYRLPVVPGVIVFASVGIATIARQVAARDWRALRLVAVLAGLLAVFVNWPIYRPTSFVATSYYNLGNLYHRAGRLDDAVAAWQDAVRAVPNYRKPQRAIGEAYIAAGRFAEAIEPLRRSAVFRPPGISIDPDVTFLLAVSLWKSGHDEDAAAIFLEAGHVWPQDGRFAAALAEMSSPQGASPK